MGQSWWRVLDVLDLFRLHCLEHSTRMVRQTRQTQTDSWAVNTEQGTAGGPAENLFLGICVQKIHCSVKESLT